MFFLFALLSASSFRSPNELGADPTAAAVSTVDVKTSNADTPLTIAFRATSKTQYTATFRLGSASTPGVTIPVVFTAADHKSTVSVTFADGSTSATKVIDIVDVADDGKLAKKTAYTITADGYSCSLNTFTPRDNTIITGFSSLSHFGKKPDGAKDSVTLTLVNDLLPAELPAGAKNTLKLVAEAPNKKTTEHVLDKSDKVEWEPHAGMLHVEYLFNDCKIKANSNVQATLVITPDLSWANQTIKYEAGAKSVASVVAALFSVLALVF
ncbi:hypothetical protein BLNAU_15225 [Blattamonas nauphoetae]|uniref:Uncharacterized protein n=1 Tax=Blattamonas nauphoetae TaxID=2049346 RepID=A0ABQ9XF36_9EUKA|nr:hypothetical protein BLNAU_15225 [Blattamonas nauphoetae]